ncbi:hypothetical protein [Pseudomonas sp. KCJK8670]|uniref:hypothetical protein n=1 Tax=Pseudomonas sp. KCJK8670 TaxID=3344558 RepID=UPI0039062B66
MLLQNLSAMGLLLFAVAAQADSQSSCEAVYADSVRNVDIQSRVITEQNDIFTRHCEVNGSLKSSSANVDLTVPVKGIKVGFSGGQSEATEIMREFCKTHIEKLRTFDSFYQVNNHVVADALQSFNQCVALEKRSVQISHVSTDARSMVVRVGFNPAEQNVTLNSVQYDTATATCRSNIKGDGEPIVVTSSSGQITAAKPFSIACERIAAPATGGALKFPRFELLVDTNQGAYSVAMPTEEMLGYDLANANRQEILASIQEQTRLKGEIDSLRAKISGVRAVANFTTQGEGAPVPCPQDGGNLDSFIRNSCASGVVSGLVQTYSGGGARCGYTSYMWSCIIFP